MNHRAITDEFFLDVDRVWASDGYSATIYRLSDRESKPSSLPFGFVPDLAPKRVDLPEPWMWWGQ